MYREKLVVLAADFVAGGSPAAGFVAVDSDLAAVDIVVGSVVVADFVVVVGFDFVVAADNVG